MTNQIFFNSLMIKAIKAQQKSQTRRFVNDKKGTFTKLIEAGFVPTGLVVHEGQKNKALMELVHHEKGSKEYIPCPFGDVGSKLWVRETWACLDATVRPNGNFIYKADYEDQDEILNSQKWKPSIHMPLFASRFSLIIKNIRVELLNDISDVDAKAEGIEQVQQTEGFSHWYGNKNGGNDYAAFKYLWVSIYGPESWASNPWLWVIDFDVHHE